MRKLFLIAIVALFFSSSAFQDEVDSKVKDSVDRGLAWLARSQNKDGSFGNGTASVAATALAGLAFLAGGITPERGQHAESVKSAVSFILKCVSKEGYINERGIGRGGSGMHGHGFAVLFLASVYGMTGRDYDTGELKEKLKRAIKLSEKCQSQSGGWFYEPQSLTEEGSVTITQVAGLRAARNAGLSVDEKVVKKAIDYILGTTTDAGWVQYNWGSKGGGMQSVTLTAKGASVLVFLGKYRGEKKLTAMLDNILKNLTGKGRRGFYWLTKFFMSIATHQAGGEYWNKFWDYARKDILSKQASDGGWKSESESQQYGPAFGTALALLVLQMPYRYLPIFQSAAE